MSEDRDYPEDAKNDPDNGDYQNKCLKCGGLFTGHKRRIVCRICSAPKTILARITGDTVND